MSARRLLRSHRPTRLRRSWGAARSSSRSRRRRSSRADPAKGPFQGRPAAPGRLSMLGRHGSTGMPTTASREIRDSQEIRDERARARLTEAREPGRARGSTQARPRPSARGRNPAVRRARTSVRRAPSGWDVAGERGWEDDLCTGAFIYREDPLDACRHCELKE